MKRLLPPLSMWIVLYFVNVFISWDWLWFTPFLRVADMDDRGRTVIVLATLALGALTWWLAMPWPGSTSKRTPR